MKKVLVNDIAASRLHALREVDEYLLAKEEVANAMEYVSNIIHYSRDGEKIDMHADELLFVLHALAEYNDLVTILHKPNDRKEVSFSSSRNPFENKEIDMPCGKFIMDIIKAKEVSAVLKHKGINLDIDDIAEMTFAECTDLVGMNQDEMESAIYNLRKSGEI